MRNKILFALNYHKKIVTLNTVYMIRNDNPSVAVIKSRINRMILQ